MSAINPSEIGRNNYQGSLTNYHSDKEPSPPGQYFKHAGHHWIAKVDGDKRLHSYKVLQWSPVTKQWFQSNDVGTYLPAQNNLEGAVWLGAVEQPEFPIALPSNY
jgi:hypothetical protein